MDNISSRQIRDKFLNFFQNKDHLLIGHSSIIPKNDPTLLFINSGMAPIKSFFTGEEKPKSPRLCNIQPCIRTIDIDEIGDKHHLTSFQMLGSWSINDYFKKEAVSLAFDFLVNHLNISVDKLYATVFAGDKSMGIPRDNDSLKYWEMVGIPKDHIVLCGREDNFWGPTSDVGPCGPCTEVFYDTGVGNRYTPGGEFDTKNRYIEIWNAGVFMQFNKNADGTYSELEFTSVDTGAGLERLSMVINGKSSVYDTDLLEPIKSHIENSIVSLDKISQRDIRILTDHLRTISLVLSEGVKPSNEGRGYIPRKLIRKCVMIVNKSGVKNFSFGSTVSFIIDKYSDIYPEFVNNKNIVLSELKGECNQFNKILTSGVERLNKIKNKSNFVSGDEVFDLVTTYGVPIEIIKDYSDTWGLNIDEKSFNDKLETHKKISRKLVEEDRYRELNINTERLKNVEQTEFTGYEVSECESKVIKTFSSSGDETNILRKGDKVVLVLDKTCMYGESGGQCADKGYIFNNDMKVTINDVKKTKEGVFLHIGVVEEGIGEFDKSVSVKIDNNRRNKLEKNHSCIHLLHSALREILGKGVHQCGSKVEETSMRFDFNYDKIINQEEIFKIENLVNSYVRSNLERKIEIKSLSEAVKEGAIALFENKYSDKVRVISFGGISKELCGGTHTNMTGNIGLFVILSIENIGKGVKRVAAVSGEEALKYVQNRVSIVDKMSRLIKVRPEQIEEKIQKILFTNETKKQDNISGISMKDINYINNLKYKCAYIVKDGYSKTFTDDSINIADNIGGVFMCISGVDKKRIILSIGSKLTDEIRANELLKLMMNDINGKGGGNERTASGGVEINIDRILNSLMQNLS